MWLATLSILGQVVYNLEISRYALYCGEPIFTGKFRTPPGRASGCSRTWCSILARSFLTWPSNAAVPLASIILREVPSKTPREAIWQSFDLLGQHIELTQSFLIQTLAFAIFLGSLIPLIFGGKIYSALKGVMTFKIVTVFSFLLFLSFCFSTPDTWREIGTGFFKFGTVPVQGGTDRVDNIFLSLFRGDGFPEIDFETVAMLAAFAAIAGQGGLSNAPLSNYTRDQGWGWVITLVPYPVSSAGGISRSRTWAWSLM